MCDTDPLGKWWDVLAYDIPIGWVVFPPNFLLGRIRSRAVFIETRKDLARCADGLRFLDVISGIIDRIVTMEFTRNDDKTSNPPNNIRKEPPDIWLFRRLDTLL